VVVNHDPQKIPKRPRNFFKRLQFTYAKADLAWLPIVFPQIKKIKKCAELLAL